MKLYVAGAHTADDYRSAVAAAKPEGVELIDPFRAERDFRGREHEPGIAHEIVQGDLADVVSADAVIANFTHNSVGTSMECWFAYSIGKPVVVFAELGARVSPWAAYIADKVCTDLHEALTEAVEYGRQRHGELAR